MNIMEPAEVITPDPKIVEIGEATPEIIEGHTTLFPNRFYRQMPNHEEKNIRITTPRVVEFDEGRTNFTSSSIITVRYVDVKGSFVQTKWVLKDYLERIGLVGGYYALKKLLRKGDDLSSFVKKFQNNAIQQRINDAARFDSELQRQASTSHIDKEYRLRQMESQYSEDPFFCKIIKGSGGLQIIDLPRHIDYMDAIDVLIEIDIADDTDGQWNEEPLAIGIQRTLLNPDNPRLKEKIRKIEEEPLRGLPEFPQYGKILRVVYREDPEEYYTANDITRDTSLSILNERSQKSNGKKAMHSRKTIPASRAILGGNEEDMMKIENDPKTKELARLVMIAKSVDVLMTAAAAIQKYISDNLKNIEMVRRLQKYRRAVLKEIDMIKDENDLDDIKIKKLLATDRQAAYKDLVKLV